MKIGVDLDEVVVEFVRGFLKFYNPKKNTNFKYEDWESYNFWEVFGGTREESIQLVDEFYSSSEFEKISLVEGVTESLEVISKENDLRVVTSRPLRFREKTDWFLRTYLSKIPLEVFYSGDFHGEQGKSKAQICRENNISLLIDDSKKYTLDCSNLGIDSFLFDRPWNQGEIGGRVKRVYSWKEIMWRLNEKEKKKELGEIMGERQCI